MINAIWENQMYKRLMLLLLLLPLTMFANDIDEKIRELHDINSQLEKTEQEMKQTVEKKKKAESDLNRTSSLKKVSDQKLRTFRLKERAVKDSLDQVGIRLVMAQERVEHLNLTQMKEIELLQRVDNSFAPQEIRHRDHRFLTALLTQDYQAHQSATGYYDNLEETREMHGREANVISRNVRSESQKSRKYQTDIRNLTTQSTKLSQEQQNLQQRVDKLRQDASSLQELINQLMAQEGRTLPTYEFTEIKILWPLRGKVIRSFGQETRAYNTSVVSNGIDIAAREGTNVVAVDDGEVIFADRYGGQGRLIIIDHQNGYFSLYGYNKDLLVQRGSKVRRGQVIAQSGMTGSASEPSLHFELRKDGRAVNPLPYFE